MTAETKAVSTADDTENGPPQHLDTFGQLRKPQKSPRKAGGILAQFSKISKQSGDVIFPANTRRSRFPADMRRALPPRFLRKWPFKLSLIHDRIERRFREAKVASILPFMRKTGIAFDRATRAMGEAFDAACAAQHDNGQPQSMKSLPSASLMQRRMASGMSLG
jgi:hypothetical protein